MGELAVTAVGADRPGIIARVTGVLLEHGGNLEDSSMTILGGQFAIALLVRADSGAAELERALAAATQDLGLLVAVREVDPQGRSAEPTHMVSVYGADRPGIVHAVAETLAEHEVNVTDLTTRVLGDERPVYAMVLEVALPGDVTDAALDAALREAVAGVEVTVRPLDDTAL
ncbi:MAG TPA: ACT domain-containing protein [Egibacteraceae bacterium]|nr:ACT domain-containing protein [Egibacteraceae bacterium]